MTTGLNGVLLALIGLAIVATQVIDRPSVAVEASVRRYALAVSHGDVEAALLEIAPDQREPWHTWVAEQAGNLYEVRGIAVRAPSLIGPPVEVTVNLDVNRDAPGDFFQATPRVPLEQYDGAWYLAIPLLAN